MKYVITIAVKYHQTRTSAGRRYLRKRFKSVLDKIWTFNPTKLKPLETIGTFLVETENTELKDLGRGVTITQI